MKNKYLILLLSLPMLLMAAGFLIDVQILGYWRLLDVGLNLFIILGLILLMRNGSLRRTRFYYPTLISMGFILIGTALVILKLPLGAILLLTGLISIPVMYSMHYMRKETKGLTDHLKWLWVTLLIGSRVLSLFNFAVASYLFFISDFVFLVLVCTYIMQMSRDREWLLR